MTRVRRGLFLCLLLAVPLLCIGQSADRIRVSLPPVLASLPIAFAEQWGLFDEHGVDVEIIGMTDNEVRSAALASGSLDLVVEDITQFLVDLDGGQRLLATSAAYIEPQTTSLKVALVTTGVFRMETIDDLLASGHMVGTVFRSDHEYLLDRLFETTLDEDVDAPRYAYMTDVLFLATWFGAQMMPAVVLPEPYLAYIGTYAPPGGRPIDIVSIANLSELERLPHLVVFRADYVESYPESVEAFYAAYGEAIDRLNGMSTDEIMDTGIGVVLPLFFQGANPDLIEQDVLDAMALSVPSFDLPVGFGEEPFDNVLAWVLEKGYVLLRPEYAAVVSDRFVP